MVYDFYGFPDHFYRQKVESSNPSNVSTLILDHLRQNDVQAHPVKRGIDHGVWCPLKVAFQSPYIETLSPEQHSQPASINTPSILPPTLSLTQVSLPTSETSIDSLKLGSALRGLRDQGFAIVGGGMSVHNLRDLMRSFQMGGGKLQPSSYSSSFLKALTEAMTVPGATDDEVKWGKALTLGQRADFRPAHPTPEHFLRTYLAGLLSNGFMH